MATNESLCHAISLLAKGIELKEGSRAASRRPASGGKYACMSVRVDGVRRGSTMKRAGRMA